jgi:hypothetical protein
LELLNKRVDDDLYGIKHCSLHPEQIPLRSVTRDETFVALSKTAGMVQHVWVYGRGSSTTDLRKVRPRRRLQEWLVPFVPRAAYTTRRPAAPVRD